ncbi:hypothetical protein H9Q69_001077 [Fusarium xylarioides]|nr:hypothetical protein H9Q69_001077 [Fusarium xylarioides]
MTQPIEMLPLMHELVGNGGCGDHVPTSEDNCALLYYYRLLFFQSFPCQLCRDYNLPHPNSLSSKTLTSIISGIRNIVTII